MTGRDGTDWVGRVRGLWYDERASAPGDTIGLNSTLGLLVLAVLGLPPLVALVGGWVRRGQAVEYMVTAGASLVSVFALAGIAATFAAHWTVLGILGVLAALSAHLWQYRADRVDLLVVGGIYAMPIGLATVLFLQLVV